MSLDCFNVFFCPVTFVLVPCNKIKTNKSMKRMNRRSGVGMRLKKKKQRITIRILDEVNVNHPFWYLDGFWQ